MKRIFMFIISCALVVLSGCSQNAIKTKVPDQPNTLNSNPTDAQSSLKLATAVPVIKSMAEELIANTDIELVYIPSSRYSIKRVPGWLKRQPTNNFPTVDAVAGISSIWPTLDIYPHLRAQNIHVIPMDLAHAYVPGGERVALTESTTKTPHYFWLNPANSLIMLGILHRDVQALVSSAYQLSETQKTNIEAQLTRNHQWMTKSLRQLQIDLDNQLMSLDTMQVIVDSEDFYELAASTLLPTTQFDEAKESGFPSLLITTKKSSHKKLKNTPENILVWSIDDFAKPRKGSFTERWKNNISSLSDLQ